MGPRPGGHGKPDDLRLADVADIVFQWGHDPEVMVRPYGI